MFDKTLTNEKVKLYYDNNFFAFIVHETSNETFYGFNLGDKNECDAAFKFWMMKMISLLLVGKLLEQFPNG